MKIEHLSRQRDWQRMNEIQRQAYDQNIKDKRSLIHSRGIVTMDRRRKIRMCAYGSCREEFYVKGDKGCGMTLYCLPCRSIVRKATSTRWRKRNRLIINKKNALYWVKFPNKQHENYLKRKALKEQNNG